MQTYIVVDGSLADAQAIIAGLTRLARFRAIADPMRHLIIPMLRPDFVAASSLGPVFSRFGRFWIDYKITDPRQCGGAALLSGSIDASAPIERLTPLSMARIVNNKMVIGRKVVGRRLRDPVVARQLAGSWRPGYILGAEILVFCPDGETISARNDVKRSLACRIRAAFR